MSHLRTCQALLLLSTLAIAPAFGTRTHHASASRHLHSASLKHGKKKASRLHGQRVIDSERATQIQTALIQQKYLQGEPSKQWDAQTQQAMRQYQLDHGWQTKLTPNSRALISLGLGPNHPAAAPRTVASSATGDSAAQGQPAEGGENTLASVHSIAQ